MPRRNKRRTMIDVRRNQHFKSEEEYFFTPLQLNLDQDINLLYLTKDHTGYRRLQKILLAFNSLDKLDPTQFELPSTGSDIAQKSAFWRRDQATILLMTSQLLLHHQKKLILFHCLQM